jgi:hypothetical protein
MLENENQVNQEVNSVDTDYIDAINELKANSVDKESYDKLRAENQKLLASLISGNKIEEPEIEVKYDPNELRKKLFNKDQSLSNLEYIDTALKLRDALIQKGERDPFLPVGSRVDENVEQHETAERVASILQECVDFAQGDSGIFSAELQRRTSDIMPPRRGR